MAQQGSNAPRRKRFGDSLEGMLGRNMFAPQMPPPMMQRPMPTPMMPRPMEMGGAVQYFANGGNANQQAAASMLAAGIGNVGGKAITSEAQSIQDRFSGLANRRKRRRRKRRARREAERLAAEQAAAEAAALAASQNAASSLASLPTGGPGTFPPAAPPPPPPSTDITPEVFVPEAFAPEVNPASNFMNIEQPDRSIDREIAGGTFDDDPAFTQNIIPPEVIPGPQFTYDQGAIGFGDNVDITNPDYPNPMAPIPDVYYGGSTFEESEGMKSRVFPPLSYQQMLSQTGEPSEEDLEAFRASGYKFPQGPFGGLISPPRDDTTQVGTTSGFSYFPEDTTGVRPPVIGEKDDSFAESMFIGETNPYAVGGGFDVTAPPAENFESTRAMLESNIFDPDKLDPRGDQIVSPTGTGIGIPPANTGGSDKDDKSTRLTSEELEKLKASLGEQVPISGIEKVINQIIGKTFFGLGSSFADKLRNSSEAERRAIVDQHLNALNSGATPVYNDKGEYIGFNMDTMDTFADKVLAADDISVFLPGGLADADGDGVIDYDRFQQVFDAQSKAADADPFGQSTEQGFITSDGEEFFVDAGGNVVEVEDGVVPFEVGGGDDVTDIFKETITTGGGDSGGGSDTGTDTGVDTGHTVDEDGNIVCNTEGYIYNPETKICEPAKEEEKVGGTPSVGIGSGTSGESFEDILKRVVVAAPPVAPISANIRPMQEGGMAGLNRAADNFLKALAG
jgi:hypothetical protein